MSAIYKTLFEVTIGHNYYDNGVCKDLTINPLPETEKLLLGHKLVYRKGANGFKILFGTDESGETPFIDLDEGIKLTFSMHLNNPTFLNFTDLPPKSSEKYIYLFENTSRGEKVEGNLFDEYEMESDADSIPQSGPAKFNYDFTSENDKVTFQVMDPAGKLIIDKELEGENGSFSKELDFRDSPFGVYTINRISNGVVEKRERIFFADPIKIKRPFGLITIEKDESVIYDKPARFNIGFDTRSTAWKYNLMLTKDYSGYNFSVADSEKYGNSNGRYKDKIDFTERSGRQQYTKGSTIIFETGEKVRGGFQPHLVPFYESPKKGLQLIVSDQRGRTVINDLPNPAVNNLRSEVFINV